MNAPVRMVCGDCLRSVELTADESGRMPTQCPFCNGAIDSRLSDRETPTSHTMPLTHEPVTQGKNRWEATWTKGSLGTIGRFMLREVIGDGGFGVVYQAYDPRLDRDVALKVLKRNDPGERVMERFFREARAVARLCHPGIVSVYDAGTIDGRCWIAYEFINGRPLSRQLDQQKVDIPTAVHITRELADALEHAHNAGVFHRDLKPANVIMDPLGHPHLIDFGLARRDDVDSDLTRDGAILGTPRYMSPEQANGRSHLVDERSDVYCLGLLFFELLSGRRPSDGPSDLPSWKFKPDDPPPPVRTVNKDVPVALEKMVSRALANEPRERYPDAGAFSRDLKKWLDGRPRTIGLWHPLVCALMGAAAVILLMIVFRDRLTPVAPLPIVASPSMLSPLEKSVTTKEPLSPPTRLVYNPKSKMLHVSGCKYAENIQSPVWLNSMEEAKFKGYDKWCSFCSKDLDAIVKEDTASELTPVVPPVAVTPDLPQGD